MASRTVPSAAALPGRARLERHVLAVQRDIRSCAGCGMCCTAAHNSMRILPWEAQRIATHLRTLSVARRNALVARLRVTSQRYRLAGSRRRETAYTCSFLEDDLTCALPLGVKPVACLSFNPLTPDACDQEPEWFARAADEVTRRNTEAGLSDEVEAIPRAVLRALEDGPLWSVYVLVSESSGATYVGVSTDVDRRLAQHNGALPGGARSTTRGRPWQLGATFGPFSTRGAALSVEHDVKRRRGRERLAWRDERSPA